ncbi:MAG: hypothetical protein Q4G35_09935 [Propionibacteriaceae bacterium]|nr:hypothetical protein [Propionibacteriaceae bacterium]
MPERIPELDRLAAEAQEVSMLPPSEIRRRGNRRRATRTVAVTAAITVVALAAGFGIWQSPLMDQVREPQWATTAEPEVPTVDPTSEPTAIPTETAEPTVDPSHTATADPTEVATETPPVSAVTLPTWDNAPTADMLFPEYAPGEIKNQYEGLGQAAKGLCDPGEYGDPKVVLTREFGAVGDYPTWMEAMTLGYSSAEAAGMGFDLIKAAALDCNDAMTERAKLVEPGSYDATADVPFDPSIVDADPVRMAWINMGGLIPDSDYGMFGETLVLQAGQRVLWVTGAFQGQDNECAPAPGDEHIDQCQVPAAIPEMLKALVG